MQDGHTQPIRMDKQAQKTDRQAGQVARPLPSPPTAHSSPSSSEKFSARTGSPLMLPGSLLGTQGCAPGGVAGVRGGDRGGGVSGRSSRQVPSGAPASSADTEQPQHCPHGQRSPQGCPPAPQWCPPRSPLYLRLRGNPRGTGGRGAALTAPAGRCRWRGGCRRSSGNPAGWPGAPWCGCGGTHQSGHPQSRHCPVPLGGNCWVSTKPEPLLWGVSTPPSRWPCSASLAQYNPRFPSTIPDFPAWPQLISPWDPSPCSAPSRTRTPTGSSFLPPSLNWKGATFCTGKLGEPTPLQ